MGSSSDAEPMRDGEAGIDSFQEPVKRKDFFPALLPFQKKDIFLGKSLGSFQKNPMLGQALPAGNI